MSHPAHYSNRAYTDELNGNPVDHHLDQVGRDDFHPEETGDDIDEDSSSEEEEEEEEEGGISANYDAQVVVVSPVLVNESTASQGLSSNIANHTNGSAEGRSNLPPTVKKVSLKSLVIPDHLLHKKYVAPCHALCTVKSPNQFVTCVALIFLVHGMFVQYSHQTILGTANRYPFSQTELRFMNGLEHTGIVVGVVFMSFFSNRFNRPLAISVGAFICAVGSILCAIPYFAEGRMDNVSFREISLFLRGATCQKYNLSFAYQGTCNLVANQKYADILAFSLICLGQFIVGLGASLYITNSLVHIEESVSTKDSTVCFGICLSGHGLGMFGGSLMATGFSSLPEDIGGGHPLVAFRESVGAWWLGFCITAGLFLLVGLLFLCFPRWFTEPDWLLRRRERYYKKLVAKKKEADRQKKRILAIKLKKDKERAVAPETATPGNIDKRSTRAKKAVQKNGKRSHVSNPQKTTQGTDVIRVPQETGPRNPTFSEIIDGSGAHPVEPGAINTAFWSEEPGHSVSGNNVQSSHQDVHFKPNQPKSKNQSSKSGQVSDGARQEISTENGEVGAKTIKYIKKNRRSKVTKKYLMRREQFKDISRHIWRLLRNKPLALCFCGTVLVSYTITGYTAVMTAYIKTRFHKTQLNAEYATAFIVPLGFCIGTLVGGLIVGGVRKMRENLHLSSRLIIGTLPVTIICMIVLMFLRCDNIKDNTASLLKSPKNWTCQEDVCDCSDTLHDPVCGDDGYVYPSACLAGCHYIDSNPEPMKYTFSTCGCIKTPTAAASYGVCPMECSQFYAYVAIAAVGMIFFFIGLVPVVMVFLRAVRDRYKSLSIGFGVWLVYILGYIIGPVIFHEIVASQCQHRRKDCQNEEICWLYDLENLGLLLHGIVALFLTAGTFFFIGMCVLLMPSRFVNPAGDSAKLALERAGDPSNIPNIAEID